MPNPSKLEAIYGPALLTILAEMQEIFPPVQPTPHDSVEMIMYKAGQRYVVEWLLQRMEQ